MHAKSSKLIEWTLTVSLSGFLFGFDTAVISGADQPIQELWNLGDIFHGVFIMSMALWGTVIGAAFGGIPCDKFGRKKALIWIGVLYSVSAIGSALAPDPISFSIFRLIGGIGVGASAVAAPTYISEISPSHIRGRMVILYQFNLTLGILIAYLSNYFLGSFGEGSWRFMVGVEALPAIAFTLLMFRNPESPRWLCLFKKDENACREVLSKIYPAERLESLIKEIHDSDKGHKRGHALFQKMYLFPIILGFLIAFFNQLSGINFVNYYAPRLFGMVGFSKSNALLLTSGLGLINLIMTMVGIYIIDRVGRKKMLIMGSCGYIITLASLSYTFFQGTYNVYIIPVLLLLYIASHAIGQGAIIWVYISEIFPNVVRAKGQAWGTGTHWVCAASITLVMPYVLTRFDGGYIFGFFSIIMLLQLLFAVFVMPETKGKSLEEIESMLVRN